MNANWAVHSLISFAPMVHSLKSSLIAWFYRTKAHKISVRCRVVITGGIVPISIVILQSYYYYYYYYYYN